MRIMKELWVMFQYKIVVFEVPSAGQGSGLIHKAEVHLSNIKWRLLILAAAMMQYTFICCILFASQGEL